MDCLDVLGFDSCYYIDNNKIYNANTKKYLKGVGDFRYRIKTKEGTVKSITIKEIYKRMYNKVFCIDNIKPLEGEFYKEIEGTDGNYYISNYGNVKSYMSNYAFIMKAAITEKGYERLQIIINGTKVSKYVHCLVAAAWLGKPLNLEQEIHHKDFNKRNNKVSNLEYLSKLEHKKKHINRKDNDKCQEN